jgi:hypothetical protein
LLMLNNVQFKNSLQSTSDWVLQMWTMFSAFSHASFWGEGKKDGLTLISVGGSSSSCMHQKVRSGVSDNGRQSAFVTQKLV